MRERLALLAVSAVLVGLGASCSKSNSGPTPPGSGGGGGTTQTTINIPNGDGYGNTSFAPATVTVPVGRVVIWKNNDGEAHTTTSDTGLWNSNLNPAAEFQRTFNTVGTFNYKCTVHAGMSGSVIVQ